MMHGVWQQPAVRLVEENPLELIADQVSWHLVRMKRNPPGPDDKPGGLLTAAIEHNMRPPRGHPDERWFKEKYPYAYLGEHSKVFGGPKARGGGGRKARRTANKGNVTAAAIVPGGLHFGAKHGPLKKEKRDHRDKFGLKPIDGRNEESKPN